jgi:hypothetical protein
MSELTYPRHKIVAALETAQIKHNLPRRLHKPLPKPSSTSSVTDRRLLLIERYLGRERAPPDAFLG